MLRNLPIHDRFLFVTSWYSAFCRLSFSCKRTVSICPTCFVGDLSCFVQGRGHVEQSEVRGHGTSTTFGACVGMATHPDSRTIGACVGRRQDAKTTIRDQKATRRRDKKATRRQDKKATRRRRQGDKQTRRRQDDDDNTRREGDKSTRHRRRKDDETYRREGDKTTTTRRHTVEKHLQHSEDGSDACFAKSAEP